MARDPRPVKDVNATSPPWARRKFPSRWDVPLRLAIPQTMQRRSRGAAPERVNFPGADARRARRKAQLRLLPAGILKVRIAPEMSLDRSGMFECKRWALRADELWCSFPVDASGTRPSGELAQ
jgi:hypothetical protein